jgi:hypothetical protein
VTSPDFIVRTAIDETRQACNAEITTRDLQRSREALRRLQLGDDTAAALIRGVNESPASRAPLQSVLSRLDPEERTQLHAGVERLFLLQASLVSLARLADTPVCPSVKVLWCEEVCSWIGLAERNAETLSCDRPRFVDACMIASLRRFPAGQFDWVRSGLPISYLLGVELRSLPRALLIAALGLRGRSPVFFSHFGYRRLGHSLSELEANRSYYRMAQSMALQPDVKGFVASAWFRSPDTHRVSPHLAWVNRVVLDHGGFVGVRGPAAPDSGVFARSVTRRRLYEEGLFRPTLGLVIWPRRRMLEWADAHPEFGD